VIKGEENDKSWGSRRIATVAIYHARALERRLNCAIARLNVYFPQTCCRTGWEEPFAVVKDHWSLVNLPDEPNEPFVL